MKITISSSVKRFAILCVSVFCMIGSGSVFAFSVVASQLQTAFSYNSSDLNVVSGVGFAALYLPFLFIGPIYDAAGPQWTLVLAIVTYSGGYMLIWAAYVGMITGSVLAVSVYYFFVGIGSTAAYMAVIGVNVGNFTPKAAGKVTGFLHLFYAVAGSIYSSVFSTSYTTNVAGYIIFLAVSVGASAFLSIFTTIPIPLEDFASTKHQIEPDKSSSIVISTEPTSRQHSQFQSNGRQPSNLNPIASASTLDEFKSLESIRLSPEPSRNITVTASKNGMVPLKPNYKQMPALIHSSHASLTALNRKPTMAKEVRKVIVAQKMMPQTAKPSRFQNVITAEETGGGGDEEKGAPKNEDTVKNAAAKKVQFQVIASMASKQASRTQTAPSKNPSDSSKPQNKLMIFSDDNLNESLPSGGMPLLPKQQDARRLSIESRPVTAESYQSKATSAGLFSATSLQWIQDDILKSKRAKTPQTIRSGKNMSNSSLQRLNSVSRGPSVRPCMPGGHHDEAAISRMTSVKKKISPTQTQQVTLESEQMLESMSTDDFSDIHEELVSAWDILKSPVFWLYACTCIFQQGTAYMTNVSSILYSIYSLSNTQTEINDMTTRHVTYMSLFQAGAMFSFGVLSDYLESLHIVWLDRTVLMFLSQLILFAPNVVLMTSDTSDGAILFCSICTGLGFGASSCLLPILTQDFFGLQFFGTAVGFAMTGVPIGILLCNSIFGILYDKQLATQNATAITSSITCYGSICYQQSFQVFTGIQMIAVVTSLLLLLLRLKQRYAHRHEHHKSLEELNT